MTSPSPPTPLSSTQPLTTQLLSLYNQDLKTATQTPFLEQAGRGTLPKAVLEKWLCEDRIYAHAYLKFAAQLLAGIATHLPRKVDAGDIYERIADVVVEALVAIRRELGMFADIAREYKLNISDKVEQGENSPGVVGYRELFEALGTSAQKEGSRDDVLAALTLLWGTEYCYFRAWGFARSFMEQEKDGGGGRFKGDGDGGALREVLIGNWSSGGFGGFVARLGGLIDEFWVKERGGEREEKRERRVRGVWERVLEVERVFWPGVEWQREGIFGVWLPKDVVLWRDRGVDK